MEAEVQYNDLKGTAAADVTDFFNNNLQHYLEKTFDKYDSNRYQCIGCDIYITGQSVSPSVHIQFICYDKINRKHVYLAPQKEMKTDEVLSLFKRLHIVLGQSGIDNIQEIDEEPIYIE